jgi:GTPase
MTLQHLKLCISMNIPVVILLTKMDRCPDQIFKETKQEIGRILKSSELGLHPFMIKVEEDVDMVQDKMASLTPILPVSCITGQGLDLLKGLLTKLPQRRKHAKKQLDKPFEFLIEEIFQVPGVGTVVSGFVSRGMWKKGKPIFIGPLKDGTVMKVVPKSAHVAKTSVGKVCAGHQACFALPKLPRIRRMLLGKGMVAMKRSFEPSKKFIADIYLTKGTTVTVEAGKFHATLNILHAKQSAKVVNIQVGNTKQNIIRQGDSARVTFEFVKKPSFVRPGMRFILRSGHVIGYGVVKAPC